MAKPMRRAVPKRKGQGASKTCGRCGRTVRLPHAVGCPNVGKHAKPGTLAAVNVERSA